MKIKILKIGLALVISLVTDGSASDKTNTGPNAELWVGRIIMAELFHTMIVKSTNPSKERFPSVEHVLIELEQSWSGMDVHQKRTIIITVLLYGGPEGGTYGMLNRLIGADQDRALPGITLDPGRLSERLGFSKQEANRRAELLENLKSKRKYP